MPYSYAEGINMVAKNIKKWEVENARDISREVFQEKALERIVRQIKVFLA